MVFDSTTGLSELIMMCRSHSDAAFSELVTRYSPLINSTVYSYFEVESDRAEAASEACIALHRAAMTFDLEQSEVTFGLYAQICIRNRMLDMKRSRDRNFAVSTTVDIENLAVNGGIESRLIMREAVASYKKRAKELLSPYEYRVFLLVLKGCKTPEIAEKLGVSVKSVNNAKARMWRTMRQAFGKDEPEN